MVKLAFYINIIFSLLSGLLFSAEFVNLRDYTLNAAFQYDFINSEHREASAVLYFNENGSFEYREKAGRGETIFIGSYSFTENTLTLKNDNGMLRSFIIDMNSKRLILTAQESAAHAGKLFHVQPPQTGQKISYKKISPAPLNLKKSVKINAVYSYTENNNSYIMSFAKNNVFHLYGIFMDVKRSILIGKYCWINNHLTVEDEQGFRYRFNAQIKEKNLALRRISSNLILPFQEMGITKNFILRQE